MKTKLLAGSAPIMSVRIDAGFLRVPEFCELIKITKNTAALMRHRRQGPPYVKVGAKTIIYPTEAVERWLQSRLVSPSNMMRSV